MGKRLGIDAIAGGSSQYRLQITIRDDWLKFPGSMMTASFVSSFTHHCADVLPHNAAPKPEAIAPQGRS